MSAADQKVDQAADKVQDLANRMAGQEGVKAKLAEPLAQDADLIRRMKPSLIKARVKGEAPTDQRPGETVVAPSAPQFGTQPEPTARPEPKQRTEPKQKPERKGPNPWLIVGVALAVGIFLAKWIDWRGHAHPRY
jgi:hypothetical protein